MLEKTTYLITALLGIITIILIGFRFNTKKHTNFYLLLIFILSSVRFFLHGLFDTLFIQPIIRNIDVVFANTAWPLMYLYFGKLNNVHEKLKGRELLHLVLPLLLTTLFFLQRLFTEEFIINASKTGAIITILYNIFYAITSYRLLHENIWKRSSKIVVVNQQNMLIAKWTKLLYGLFLLMLIRFLINMLFNDSELWYRNKNNFLWVAALIWIVLYIKILYSPEFLYGYEILQNKIKEYKKNAIVFDHIWSTTSRQVINLQDVVLKEKIEGSIQNYIIEIEHFALNTNLFLTENFKVSDLANKLNLPKSHVLYLFKYHSTISFGDFKKIIRVQKSILLIEDGYLKTNTLESLAAVTGFSSYSPFYKSFKMITNTSPQSYYTTRIEKKEKPST
ncbi:MAG: helix-turn-helix transcriptional regulator [Flavobacterium sp.]|nr:helix-turn-helix transcriptional regulator [Flavobacterium sp.]